jgi:hypothetical protein
MNIKYLFDLSKEFFDLIYPLQEENQEENQENQEKQEEKYDQLIFLEENDHPKIPEEKINSNFDIDIDKNELCYCKEFLFLQICFTS